MQAHTKQNNLSSMTLGTLTGSVYQMADVWNMTNFMGHYCLQLHEKIKENLRSTKFIYKLGKEFSFLNEMDRQLEAQSQERRGKDSLKLFQAKMDQVEHNLKMIVQQMAAKVQKQQNRSDILIFCQSLLNDNAMARLRFIKLQRMLLEGSNQVGGISSNHQNNNGGSQKNDSGGGDVNNYRGNHHNSNEGQGAALAMAASSSALMERGGIAGMFQKRSGVIGGGLIVDEEAEETYSDTDETNQKQKKKKQNEYERLKVEEQRGEKDLGKYS